MLANILFQDPLETDLRHISNFKELILGFKIFTEKSRYTFGEIRCS